MATKNPSLAIGVASGAVPASASVALPTNTGVVTGGVTTVTDSTGGTADTTLADVTATPTQTLVNNNFADLAAQNALQVTFNAAILAELATQKTLNTAITDTLQKAGLMDPS